MKRLLRINDVVEVTGLSKTSIYRYVANETFPKPVKIGETVVAWRVEDIDEWIKGLKE